MPKVLTFILSFLLLFTLSFAGRLLPLNATLAAGIMVSSDPMQRMTLDEQKAVVWHDGKMETLVASVNFQGDARDFVWIIPVPAKPTVVQGSDELFVSLQQLTQPVFEPRPLLGRGGPYLMEGAPDIKPVPQVEVYDSKKVDVYDIATIATENTNALKKWFAENNFSYPENRQHLLRYYIDKRWYFVVAKISADSLGAGGQYLHSGHTTPLVITFPSKTIVYPLKISGATSPPVSATKIAAYSFEKGLEGWSTYAAGNLNGQDASAISEMSNNTSRDGKFSLKIYGANGIGDSYGFTSLSGLTPGTNYVFSAWAKAQKPVRGSAYIKVGQGGLAAKSKLFSLESLTEWTKIELPFVASANNHEFDLLANEMDAGGELYFDSVQIERGEEASDFTEEFLPAYLTPDNNNGALNINLYIFADRKKTAPGFSTLYASSIEPKKIEKFSLDSSGNPWMPAKKKMYLTRLTRSQTPGEITDDLFIRDADDNKSVGTATSVVEFSKAKLALFLTLPLVLEVMLIGFIVYKKKN